MSAITEAIGYGLTVSYGDTAKFSTSVTWTPITEVIEFQPADASVKKIDNTSHATANRTRTAKPGLIEPGTAKITIHWQPTLISSLRAILGVGHALKVTYNDGTTGTIEGFDGYLAKIGEKTPLDDNATCELEWQTSGPVTYTAGTA